MTHPEEVTRRVDAAIAKNVISIMNELLIELSDDAQLSREDRYTQQQRLRHAIAHRDRHSADEHERIEAERRAQLTRNGTLL